MTTTRWVLTDTVTAETWTMPINPDSMSSPLQGRTLKFGYGYRLDPRVRAFSGQREPVEWEWSGVIRSKSHYDALVAWAEKSVAVDVTDHLGRTFRVFLTEFNPTDRRPTPRVSWRLRYAMKALILERVG
jgi:hypothetical protein